MKRKGYGPIVDVSACGLDVLGDLGGRKGAMLVEDRGDRGADGLARICVAACLQLASELRSKGWLWPWLLFCLWLRRSSCLSRRNLVESLKLALGDAKIGDLRLQFSDLRVNAFEYSIHDAFAYVDRVTGRLAIQLGRDG